MDKNKEYLKQGMLQEKRRQLEALETKSERLYKDITIYLFSSDGIRGMALEFNKARQAFAELEGVISQWKATTQEIEKIEKGL